MSWRQHRAVLALTVGIVAAMSGLVAYAPTLYRLFCDYTGYGGTVRRAAGGAGASEGKGAGPLITVHFDSNVAPGLAWDFHPAQRKAAVRAGEPVKIYYEATNLSDETVVAQATFNVTPHAAAPYFFKIQCFCFTDARLKPRESARMPVVFYVDEEMLKNADTSGVRNITLSYTFFKQTVSDSDAAAARDLRKASESLDASLAEGGALELENDAPRR